MDDPRTHTFALVLAQFREWMTAKAFSRYTCRSYHDAVKRFLDWVLEATPVSSVSDITPWHVHQYQIALHLSSQPTDPPKPYSVGTQCVHLLAVRKFFAFLVATQRLNFNPTLHLELPRRPRRLPRTILSQSEARRLVEAIPGTTPLNQRNRALLEVLYATGIRLAEVLNLGVHDVDVSHRTVIIREGKGKVDRVLPLTQRAAEALRVYLGEGRPQLVARHREHPTPNAVFVSSRAKGKLSALDVDNVVKQASRKAGLNKVPSPHALRHTFATHLLAGKADVRQIQALLGHRHLSSTQIYTQVEVSDLREVIRRCHPREKEATGGRT